MEVSREEKPQEVINFISADGGNDIVLVMIAIASCVCMVMKR
jgi:hypothetical protein